MNYQRLIEAAFPLKQVTLDSVYEKNVRHGHISTLHIWPARRPLAASRAASRAALLPDPGRRDGRRKLLARMAGQVVEAPSADGERMKEETRGGIFHWGREDGGELARFRAEIREAFGGRAPRMLDPFAGGGAIPLEAMRLGCEAVAADINPVAGFILRCTLHYPRLLAGRGERGRRAVRRMRSSSRCGARGAGGSLRPFRCRRYATDRPRPPKLLETDEDGQVSVASFNAEFDSFHPENEANPRWVAKPVSDPHRPGPPVGKHDAVRRSEQARAALPASTGIAQWRNTTPRGSGAGG